jgi:DNA topoisomerase-1
MPKALLVVESPAKANTISGYLGPDFVVMSSMGHVRDLPERELGIDIEAGFRPRYVTLRDRKQTLADLKRAAKGVERIVVATDPDREGEAIGWHVAEAIGADPDRVDRVLFNEITRSGVDAGMADPRKLDERKINAQQARRVLDRLVGYKVSPFLWQVVAKGLSAGRVQSVALRLVCEREAEIDAFMPVEHWTLEVTLFDGERDITFIARVVTLDGRKVAVPEDGKKPTIPDEATAHDLVAELRRQTFVVAKVSKKMQNRRPPPPFITSTLQQEAARRLGFTANRTMSVAQQLYEGVQIGRETVGLITYMRTDSTRLAKEAAAEAREHLRRAYGADYAPSKPRTYAAKKGAQDAHEAIRPTSVSRTPDQMGQRLDSDQARLYRLIWERFVACQAADEKRQVTTVDVTAGRFGLRASGYVVIFPGYTAVYKESEEPSDEEARTALPGGIVEGADMVAREIAPKQHFTKPPPRYSEATLVRELEARGIGRPSTYAQILSTIGARGYVDRQRRQFVPTELGGDVNKTLLRAFPDVVDVDFTARMEDELDRVESGVREWAAVVRDFYEPLEQALDEAFRQKRSFKEALVKPTDERCDKCGAEMVIRWGRRGKFLACSAFPKCRNARPLEPRAAPEPTDETCDQCSAPMVIRTGRRGKFLACSAYPKCENTRPLPLGITCPEPECDGELAERRTRRGRVFYGCTNYPKCRFTLPSRPVDKVCPLCGVRPVIEVDDDPQMLRCPACKATFERETVPEVAALA